MPSSRPNVCAGALLLRDGAVLLGLRSPTRSFYPNVWDVFGGHVQPGETPEQALARELQEEIGITPTSFSHAALLHDPSPERHGEYEYHLFTVSEWTGTPHNRQPEEHAELRWFPLREAAELPLAHPDYPDLFRSVAGDPSSSPLHRLRTGGPALDPIELEKPMSEQRATVVPPEGGELLSLRPPSRGGRVAIKVDPVNTGAARFSMGTQEVVPGDRIPIHLHEQQEEVLYILSGEGLATLGEEGAPVLAGTTVYIPPGVWHGLENTGRESLHLVWVISPTGLEGMFREIGTPPGAEGASLSEEEFAEVVRRHGMRLKP